MEIEDYRKAKELQKQIDELDKKICDLSMYADSMFSNMFKIQFQQGNNVDPITIDVTDKQKLELAQLVRARYVSERSSLEEIFFDL